MMTSGAMIDTASIDIRTLARRLGGEPAGRNKVLCPGPNHTRLDRSLQVTLSSDAPDGFITHSFAGDDWRDCRDYIRERLGLPQWEPGNERDRRPTISVREFDRQWVDAEAAGPRDGLQPEDLERIKRAQALWNEARDLRGTLAQGYLQLRKILTIDDEACGAVRFHPRCPWRNESTGNTDRVPALIAAFRAFADNAVTAVHRIALTPDAHKLGRRMLGVVRRSAIKIDADISGGELAIGEGIETCLAARLLGIRPTWCVGSVGMISTFPLLPGVTTLRLLGENDKASEEAVQYCGTRWTQAGRRVRVIKPTFDHKDLNDALGAHDGTTR